MSSGEVADPKGDALRRKGALNRNPERVTDERFREDEFYDARDLVQVKYEMLRRVRAEGKSVTEAAAHFGFSRFSFYEAQSAFNTDGLPGLVPKKPGPRGRHKLNQEVLAFLREALIKEPDLRTSDLVALVKERYGLTVHPRTIERALSASKKKRR